MDTTKIYTGLTEIELTDKNDVTVRLIVDRLEYMPSTFDRKSFWGCRVKVVGEIGYAMSDLCRLYIDESENKASALEFCRLIGKLSKTYPEVTIRHMTHRFAQIKAHPEMFIPPVED